MIRDDERYWANMVLGVIENLERPMLMYEGEKMIVRKALKAYLEANDRKTEPSIDIIRCKDCDNYAGEGMYCAWNVLTGDMGYCHHARPKGSTDITAEQTEPSNSEIPNNSICSKMEQVDKDINVRSKESD